MKQVLFTILFSSIFFSSMAYGCSLIGQPVKDFDSSEYIFIGEVIGYTDAIEFHKNENRGFIESNTPKDWYLKWTNGLVVKVKDSVNLPKSPKTHFEVFPFDLGGACETLGVDKWKLQKRFPINSEILVIASEPTSFDHILPNGNFRLEERHLNNLIALNPYENNQKLVLDNTEFDYIKTKNFENYFAAKFESRIDLLRLKNASNEKARREILERLSHFYRGYSIVDLYALSRKYLSNVDEAEELFRKSLRLNNFSEKIIQEEIEKRRKLYSTKVLQKN